MGNIYDTYVIVINKFRKSKSVFNYQILKGKFAYSWWDSNNDCRGASLVIFPYFSFWLLPWFNNWVPVMVSFLINNFLQKLFFWYSFFFIDFEKQQIYTVFICFVLRKYLQKNLLNSKQSHNAKKQNQDQNK